MDRFLIYGLVDPTTGQLRYIGRSSSGLERPRRHAALSGREDTHKARWIRECLDLGLRPKIILLQAFEEPDILNQAEIHWIAYFRAMGCPLTNLTDGGGGCSGYRQSESHIQKRAALHVGSRRSPEARARMSTAAKNRPVHPNAYKALSRKLKGSKQDLEFVKRRTAHLKRPVVDQHGQSYESVQAAERMLGLASGSVSKVAHGHRAAAKGYVFRFLEAD